MSSCCVPYDGVTHHRDNLHLKSTQLSVSYWHIAWWALVAATPRYLFHMFTKYDTHERMMSSTTTMELWSTFETRKKGLKAELMTRSSDIITQQFMIFCYPSRLNRVFTAACSPHHGKNNWNEILISCTSKTTPFDFFFNKYLQNARQQWERESRAGGAAFGLSNNAKGFAVCSVSNYAENSRFMPSSSSSSSSREFQFCSSSLLHKSVVDRKSLKLIYEIEHFLCKHPDLRVLFSFEIECRRWTFNFIWPSFTTKICV